MNKYGVLSDQYYNWSVQYAESIDVITAAATQGPAAQTAEPRTDPEGLAHRALQALRKARMQVRERVWPRAQILPLRKPNRPKAANGLRAAGILRPSGSVSGQLPACPGDHQRDLTDQSGAPPPEREVVEARHGCRRHRSGHHVRRHPPDLHSGGQHARRAAPRRFGNPADTGGQP